MPDTASRFIGFRLAQQVTSTDFKGGAAVTGASAVVNYSNLRLGYTFMLDAGETKTADYVTRRYAGIELEVRLSDIRGEFGLDLVSVSAACSLGLARSELKTTVVGLGPGADSLTAVPPFGSLLEEENGLEQVMDYVQRVKDWMVDNYHSLEPTEHTKDSDENENSAESMVMDRAKGTIFARQQLALGHKLSKASLTAVRRGLPTEIVQAIYATNLDGADTMQPPPAAVRKASRDWLSKNPTPLVGGGPTPERPTTPTTTAQPDLVDPWARGASGGS
jgi:hypothetical protein